MPWEDKAYSVPRGVSELRYTQYGWHRTVWNPPAWHRGLPGPSGPEPQKSPERAGKSPKTQLRTLYTLSDSFRTLWGSRARRAREPSVQAGGFLAVSFLGAPSMEQPELVMKFLTTLGALFPNRLQHPCEDSHIKSRFSRRG